MVINDNQHVILSGTQLNAEMASIINEITLDIPVNDGRTPNAWLVSPALAERLATVADNYEFPTRPLAESIMRIDPKRLAEEVRALSPEYEDGELVGYLFSHFLMIRIHCLARATSRPTVAFADMTGTPDDELYEAIDQAVMNPIEDKQMMPNMEAVGESDEELMAAFEKHVATENLDCPMGRRVGKVGYESLQTDCLFEGFKIALGVLRKDLAENPAEAPAADADNRIKKLIEMVSAQLKVGQAALDTSATRH